MTKMVVSMQNTLLSETAARSLLETGIFRLEWFLLGKTAAALTILQAVQAEILLMEFSSPKRVHAGKPTGADRARAFQIALLLLCDENSAPHLTHRVMHVRQDRRIPVRLRHVHLSPRRAGSDLRKETAVKKRLPRIFTGLLAALTLCLCPCFAGAAPTEDIPAVKIFWFTRSGMSAAQGRSYSVKETKRGRFVWIDLYDSCHYVLPMTDADTEAFSALLHELKLTEWNGFRKSNPDVLDGEDFSLSVVFSDGSELSAYGSNSFPSGYSDKMSRVEDFFRALMEDYEIDIPE